MDCKRRDLHDHGTCPAIDDLDLDNDDDLLDTCQGIDDEFIHPHVSLGGKTVVEFLEKQTLTRIQPCILYVDIDVVSVVAVTVTTVVC